MTYPAASGGGYTSNDDAASDELKSMENTANNVEVNLVNKTRTLLLVLAVLALAYWLWGRK